MGGHIRTQFVQTSSNEYVTSIIREVNVFGTEYCIQRNKLKNPLRRLMTTSRITPNPITCLRIMTKQ